MTTSVIEFLRARERARFAIWRACAWSDPLIAVRFDEWMLALRALNAELEARARLVGGVRA